LLLLLSLLLSLLLFLLLLLLLLLVSLSPLLLLLLVSLSPLFLSSLLLLSLLLLLMLLLVMLLLFVVSGEGEECGVGKRKWLKGFPRPLPRPNGDVGDTVGAWVVMGGGVGVIGGEGAG
jgi:hypothetical protein